MRQQFIEADHKCLLYALFDRNVVTHVAHIFVRRPVNPTACNDLFDAVCAPAGNARDRKDVCIEFTRYIEHGIYKALIKIDIRTYPFIGAVHFSKHVG